MNKAILMGRLTADPELKQTPNGVFGHKIYACRKQTVRKRGSAAGGFYKLCCVAKSSGVFVPIFSQGQYGSRYREYSDGLI